MDKQTYTQRVDAIVERMANTMYTGKRLVAERYNPVILCCAQQAVSEIAEAIRHYDHTLLDSDAAYVERYLKEQGLIPDNEPGILPMQPGEPGYGGYNPDNPPPYDEDMPIVCPSCLMANITIGTKGNCLCNECNEQFKIEQ